MDVGEVVRLVRAVASVDESSSRSMVLQGVADLAAVRRWCDGREVALAGFMAVHSPIPEKPMANAARSSQKKAKRALRRNETTKETPNLGKALEEGKVSGEHVDAAGAALRGVDADKRQELAKRIDALGGRGVIDESGGVRGARCETSSVESRTTKGTIGSRASSERFASTIVWTRRRE